MEIPEELQDIKERIESLTKQERMNLMDNTLMSFVQGTDSLISLNKVNELVSDYSNKLADAVVELDDPMIHPSAALVSLICGSIIKLRQEHSQKLINSLVDQTLELINLQEIEPDKCSKH